MRLSLLFLFTLFLTQAPAVFAQTGADPAAESLAQLQASIKAYEAAFTAAAQKRVKQYFSPRTATAVRQLQQRIAPLSSNKELTKQAVKESIEPVLLQLQRAYAPLPLLASDLYLSDANVKTLRATMLARADAWNKAAHPNANAQQLARYRLGFLEQLAEKELNCLSPIMTMFPKGTCEIMHYNRRLYDGSHGKLPNKLEYDTMAKVNRLRLCAGKNVLKIDPRMVACCRDHSKDMGRLNFFDHTSPIAGKEQFWTRAESFGTKANGENLYEGTGSLGTAQKAVQAWIDSPLHHVNLFDSQWNTTGVGTCLQPTTDPTKNDKQIYTQLFGKGS